jgi:hypothetical protein
MDRKRAERAKNQERLGGGSSGSLNAQERRIVAAPERRLDRPSTAFESRFAEALHKGDRS